MDRFLSYALSLGFVVFSASSLWAQDTEKKAESGESEEKSPEAKAGPPNPFPDAVSVPPGILDGGSEWLNTSSPIDLKDLRGKIVLLDFWTYCCINCIHVLPDLKFLEEKYKNELVVIGVHSAKFENEKLSENIRDAILRYEIKHPVVNDNEMLIWRKFGTRSWPTLALIDPEGNFAGAQGGEGNRQLFDTVIGKLADYHRWKGTLDEEPIVFDLEERKTQPTPLRYPGKVLADEKSGRLFISDSNHNRIVITDLTGTLVDVVGSGAIGRADGKYAEVEFDHPQGMELVGKTLYVADTENHLIRAVDLDSKTVSTVAGTGVQGRPREVHGDVRMTNLNSPWALCHINGILYIAMAGPHQIWSHEIGSQSIGVYAGNAREDITNGELDESSFAQPSGLTANADGTGFYVADSEGSSIRLVPTAKDGKVSTIAGTSELPRQQSLFAFGDVDAIGSKARFQHPLGVAWHDGHVYVADAYNHKVRKVNAETGAVTTWLGDGSAGKSMKQLSEPSGLSVAGGKLYIADTNNHRILTADLATQDVNAIQLNGLKAPLTKKSRQLPDVKAAEQVAEQKIASGKEVTVFVDLAVPSGCKLNALAPVTWEIFVLEGDQVLAPAALEGRDEAAVADDVATFKVPLSETAGSATVAVEVSYGYCNTTTSNICKLASATWTFPLTVTDEAESSDVKLLFPEVSDIRSGSVRNE